MGAADTAAIVVGTVMTGLAAVIVVALVLALCIRGVIRGCESFVDRRATAARDRIYDQVPDAVGRCWS